MFGGTFAKQDQGRIDVVVIMGKGNAQVHVEELVRRAAEQGYEGPQAPFPTDDLLHGVDESLPLGRPARHLFMIDFDAWTFLNHGAFGGTCVPAHAEASRWREHCERQPLRFLDRELFPQLVRVMRELADFVHASPTDLVLLPNATTGLNIVIKSCDLGPGDVLYMLDIGYGSVKKMAEAAVASASRQGAPRVVMGKVDFPISSDDELMELVSRSMPPETKLAVFDAVTSNTAVVLPIQRLVELCKSRGIPVLIDAAHALGQLPVDLQALGADFYVTNCHKWLAGPRGSALLWVHPDRKASVRPLVVSHGSGSGFTSDFIWDGCRDYAPYLGLSSALRMWRALGPQRCHDYCTELLSSAVQLLTESWHTTQLVPLSMCARMALVGLPGRLLHRLQATGGSPGAAAPAGEEADRRHSGEGFEGGEASAAEERQGGAAEEAASGQLSRSATSADAKLLQDLLHHNYRIEVPIKCIQGLLFVRISAHIYNDLEDYKRLDEAVLDLLDGGGQSQQPQT